MNQSEHTKEKVIDKKDPREKAQKDCCLAINTLIDHAKTLGMSDYQIKNLTDIKNLQKDKKSKMPTNRHSLTELKRECSPLPWYGGDLTGSPAIFDSTGQVIFMASEFVDNGEPEFNFAIIELALKTLSTADYICKKG